MLSIIASYWPIITSIAFVALALVRLYVSHHDLKRDVEAMKQKHEVDIQAAADAHGAGQIRDNGGRGASDYMGVVSILIV